MIDRRKMRKRREVLRVSNLGDWFQMSGILLVSQSDESSDSLSLV